ncbi:hypothetical protein B0H11DRAFT_2308495, partial [Mycena galericulata]
SQREEASKLSGARASYCFDLDINEASDEDPPNHSYSVDASAFGNWTRFLNHSCSPNTQTISVVCDSTPQDNMPYLAFVATTDIAANTELTVDYNPAHQRQWELRKYKPKSSEKRKRKKEQILCLCGTKNCRGWLLFSPA